MQKNAFVLGNSLGYVIPAFSSQFSDPEEMNVIIRGIAKAVGNELAFLDFAKQPDKLDMLPNIHAQIQEDWAWVEALIVSFRELCPLEWTEMS